MMRNLVMAGVLVFSTVSMGAVYDFGKNGDNKNNVTWESRATIETMIGNSVKCNGVAQWGDDLSKNMIAIAVPVESIQTGISDRDDHLRSSQWMDASKYPNVHFKTTKIEVIDKAKNLYRLTGAFTCKGVTKERTVEATIKAVPAKPGLEKYGYVGDILHINAKFSVKLGEHNITPPANLAGVKVAEEVTVMVDLFGFTNDKPERAAEEVNKVVAEVTK